MNHREDWAMISHLLCGHMTRLLETRGNGPMFTLRTHDPMSCVYKVYMRPLPRVSNRIVMCPQSVHGTVATCFQ
jgi:hypothetical protein